MSFDILNLHPQILKAIRACGFEQPTPVQQATIPLVMAGHDVMVSAQTGTGKTAAFVLPVLNWLSGDAAAKNATRSSAAHPNPAQKRKGKRNARTMKAQPRVLVLTPTRELAMQVTSAIQNFGRYMKVTSGAVVGGLPYGPQIRMLQQGPDLLVATPGRLMDHMESDRIDFSQIKTFILDEADRMLDMGFIDDVRKIGAAMPVERQTLLFSATLEGPILKIARELLNNPERVQLADNRVRHDLIAEHMHHVDDIHHKHKLLRHYIDSAELGQAVIFTATKLGAGRLARKLADQGHDSAALHGDMSQKQRKYTVEQMRRGKVRLLVATDVAARGLDIQGISHVINFDLPMNPSDYIHRIGRTGRAGANGLAISLVEGSDRKKLADIERLTGQKLPRTQVPGLEPVTPEPQHRSGSGSKGKSKHRGQSARPRFSRGGPAKKKRKSVARV